jgi:hypothetical protein
MTHVEGYGTIATAEAQHVQGKYNIENSNYAHIVGNGSREDEYDNEGKLVEQHRSNAHTLDWDGNAWFAGNVTVGANRTELATKEWVTTEINNKTSVIDWSNIVVNNNDWSYNSNTGYYQQEVDCQGMLNTDIPMVDI